MVKRTGTKTISLAREYIPTHEHIKREEKGITLVALIITIIVLVILAAVSVAAVYQSKIVNYAINGTMNYAGEGTKENKVLEETTSLIESAVKKIEKIKGGKEPTPETPKGLTKEELGSTEMIGKYVKYMSNGSNYTVDGTYSGTGSDQTFSTNNDMKWRIWGVEGNKLLLISETTAPSSIQLQGANGYNNVVKLLNEACSTAFGNTTTYGSGAIKARSINQDDIDKVTNMTTDTQRKAVFSDYGTTETPTNTNCPGIYAEEPGNTGGILDRSSQSSWYTTTTTFTSVKCTYYTYNITNYATQTMYDALLTNMTANSTSGIDSHTKYWVASRCLLPSGNYSYFNAFLVDGGKVAKFWFYDSSGVTTDPSYAVRPMIEVNLDSVAVGSSGIGTRDNAYSMAKI